MVPTSCNMGEAKGHHSTCYSCEKVSKSRSWSCGQLSRLFSSMDSQRLFLLDCDIIKIHRDEWVRKKGRLSKVQLQLCNVKPRENGLLVKGWTAASINCSM